MLDRVWRDAGLEWKGLPRQSSFGANITVRLASLTASAYRLLVANSVPPEAETQCVYAIAWERSGRFRSARRRFG
jgi:hypothetical protein